MTGGSSWQMLQGPVAGTDRTQLGSDPEQQETGRAWSWKTAMRMAPVAGEGNPVDTPQKGGVQVLEEHGEREEPLICSPRFLSFPLDGAGRTGSTYHHPPLTPDGCFSAWTSPKPGPTYVQLPSSLRNVASASGA